MHPSIKLLIGVVPPVWALSLLRPKPPKAGRVVKQPPITFAVPNAISSRLALSDVACSASFSGRKLFAVTDDSKKPRSAIRKDVLKTMLISSILCKGHRKVGRLEVEEPSEPSISRPLSWSESDLVSAVATTITMRRSGNKAMDG